jgi:hypothetical protein
LLLAISLSTHPSVHPLTIHLSAFSPFSLHLSFYLCILLSPIHLSVFLPFIYVTLSTSILLFTQFIHPSFIL